MDFDGVLARSKQHSKQTQKVEWQMRCGGCAVSLGVKSACSALNVWFSSSVIMIQLNVFCLPKNKKKFSRFWMVRNGFSIAKKLLHRCTGVHARVCLNFGWRVQHARNRRLEHQYLRYTGVVDITVNIYEYTLKCARVCAVCSLALGDKGGGFS